MPAPPTSGDFLDLVQKSGLADEKKLGTYVEKLRAARALPDAPGQLAGLLVRDGLLTIFQAEQILLGKWRGFTIGPYRVLERLGSGDGGSVYLCQDERLNCCVAVKVLPAAKVADSAALARFLREARVAACLEHPNIIRLHQVSQEGNLHFLVSEYIDGSTLHEITRQNGVLDVSRAAHYIRQAVGGLQHLHGRGLVHRDMMPRNLLIDRKGLVKIIDMGRACPVERLKDILARGYDESDDGTPDYLAPEQTRDSIGVDLRTDIYGLGATFYFCLSGRPPSDEGTIAQKLIWHQTCHPQPIRDLRPDVPEGVVAIVEKMMAKDPARRYQTANEVADALTPWTQSPIPPPSEAEMPQLSPAAAAALRAGGQP
jgi:serine/threonine protein kinase